MYRLDWVEQLKLRTAVLPSARSAIRVSPAVWKLGMTSFLTDISAEMVNSILPVYLILHLRLSPLQYGAIDGIYNGFAIAVLCIIGGVVADRTRRHKEVAAAGYAISAICKLLFLGFGTVWTWMAVIVAIDRTGKGARTAPRDALISFNSSEQGRATAFAVHRAMDAGGSLLGPFVAFAILNQLPGAFEGVWVISFVFGLLGVAVLWLFVDNPTRPSVFAPRASLAEALGLFRQRRFLVLVVAGVALSVGTISDGFFYLLLDERGGIGSTQLFPLLYVITAGCYMLLSIPIGVLADRKRRMPVLLGGYGVLWCLYAVVAMQNRITFLSCITALFFYGLYYAATEGILMAMASSVIPLQLRTSGLALFVTFTNAGKFISSILFGWLWGVYGSRVSAATFVVLLSSAIVVSWKCMRQYDESSE
jgi:MFS family permease